MFLTVCLNPTLQKTLRFSSVTLNVVNRAVGHRLDVSGKGINVTRVLTQLGKKAVHLTQLGGRQRPLFLSLCEQDGLSVDWVESGSEIRFCYTMLTENDGAVTELVEESEPVDAGTEEVLLKKFDDLLSLRSQHSTPHCLIVSGKNAAGFSDIVIPEMVRKAKERGLKIILDIRGCDLINSLKYEPDIIKPNLEEFIATYKIQPTKDLLIDFTQKHKCGVILTNGSRNILAASENNFFEINVPAVKAVNSIGCGDAFTAGFAAAMFPVEENDGVNFREAITEGIRCGALNAGLLRPGVIC